MVHNVSSPSDSTSWAMIVSTSDSGEPARISLRMLRTDSLEMIPGSSLECSTLDRTAVGEGVAFSINCPFLGVIRFGGWTVGTTQMWRTGIRSAWGNSAIRGRTGEYVYRKGGFHSPTPAGSHTTLSRNGQDGYRPRHK